jgi:hypothetical protein
MSNVIKAKIVGRIRDMNHSFLSGIFLNITTCSHQDKRCHRPFNAFAEQRIHFVSGSPVSGLSCDLLWMERVGPCGRI